MKTIAEVLEAIDKELASLKAKWLNHERWDSRVSYRREAMEDLKAFILEEGNIDQRRDQKNSGEG